MTLGVCDRCLEPVLLVRAEDGKRISLDPTPEERVVLRSGVVPRVTPNETTKHGIGELRLEERQVAYRAITYLEHDCPLARTPSPSREVAFA